MEKTLTLLKSMLAQAVGLGTELQALNYAGKIHDPEAAAVRASLDRLRALTTGFLDEAGLRSVSADDVLPLFNEIQRGAANRRNR